jgi:serine protease
MNPQHLLKHWLRWIGLTSGFILLGWLLVSLTGFTTQGSYNSIAIDFREDIGKGQVIAALDEIAKISKVRPRLNSEFSEVDQVYVVDGDQALLQKLRRSPWAKNTEVIEPNYLYSLPEASQAQFPVNPGKGRPKKGNSNIPNDPLYPQQWNFHRINAEAAWAITKGKGVTIAIIDTGIAKVPDLNELNVVEGYDFINDETNAADDHGHGTHIAGTISQTTNNGYGAAGLAPEARLMPLKVVTVGGTATAVDIAEAVRLAVDRNADVINLSLAGTGYSQLMQQSIDYAYRKGVVLVAAAGNSNQSTVTYPARYRHVLAVSALDMGGRRTAYSNFGAGVDVSAPGGLVTSEKPMGGVVQHTFDLKTKESLFSPYQGSSFAAAHVSGAIGLMKSVHPLRPEAVEEILARSSHKATSDPLNEYGAGQLDVGAAVQWSQSKPAPPQHFWRWLNQQSWLSPYLWFDADMMGSQERLLVLIGAVMLALILTLRFALRWNGWLFLGLLLGSSGLFLLQGVYCYGAPQWLFRLLGSALPEVGTTFQGIAALDPLSASALLPLALWLVLGRSWQLRWLAIGVSIGMVPGLIAQMFPAPEILQIGSGWVAQLFLAVNVLACGGLSYLFLRPFRRSAQPLATRPPTIPSPPRTRRPKAGRANLSIVPDRIMPEDVELQPGEDPIAKPIVKPTGTAKNRTTERQR